MRQIINNKRLAVLMLVMSMAAASCLKDKGFENGEYGAVRNTEGKEFLTIPLASKKLNTLGLESKSGMQKVELFALSYDYVNPAAATITGTLQLNNDLVKAADSTATILPATAYTVPSMNAVVAKGNRISSSFALEVNTSLLDPTKKYGIGFTLAGVDKPGVSIPSNLKNVVFVFSIKNKFDGVYTIRSRMAHPADRAAEWLRTPFTYPYDIHLITAGPKVVTFYNTAFGAGFHPLMVPGVSGFGATQPVFEFDDNNKLISVTNGVPNPPNGRAFQINTAVTDSRFDPATKTVYAAFIMTQPGFEPIPIYDTLTFKQTRP